MFIIQATEYSDKGEKFYNIETWMAWNFSNVFFVFECFDARNTLTSFSTSSYWKKKLLIIYNWALDGSIIEIGLEQASFFCFWPCKKPADYGPNNTKNSSLKCDFLMINY
jgi:hypothetical protein